MFVKGSIMQSLAKGLSLAQTRGYARRAMATVQDIRRANLIRLLDECAQDIGTDRGAAAELARRSGVPAPFISQFKNARHHQGGRARSLGDDSARKLERGMGKPVGWMDVERSELREHEAAFLDLFRLLTREQQELLAASATEYVRLNVHPTSEDENRRLSRPH